MAQSPSELTRVFDEYLAAVKAGDFQKLTAAYRDSWRQQVIADYGKGQEQRTFLTTLAEMAPDSYDSPTVTPLGSERFLLRVVAKKNVPPQIQKQEKLPPVVQMPMVIEFAREGGAWKMGPPAFGEPPQPAQPKRPKDQSVGNRADYLGAAQTEIGGPILRYEKHSAGTVYVLRVMNDEAAVFVPASLVKPQFTMGKILVVRGARHKGDALRFWAEQASLE